MLYWTIQWIIISLVLIILIHNLYTFLKNTLTVPKIKDLVNNPAKRYNEIHSTIKNNHTEENNNPINITEVISNANADTTNIHELPTSSIGPTESKDMKDELKHFLSELSKKSTKNSTINTPSSSLQTTNEMNTGAFSNY